jgi:hypothetical protein
MVNGITGHGQIIEQMFDLRQGLVLAGAWVAELRIATPHVEQPPAEPHLLPRAAALVTDVVRVAEQEALLLRLAVAF